jgi:large subunit ribosomal protein L30
MTKAKQPVQARKDAAKKIRVTLIGGLRGTLHNHRESVKGLGLKRIRHTVEVEDTPSIRGMINQVSYLVKVEE